MVICLPVGRLLLSLLCSSPLSASHPLFIPPSLSLSASLILSPFSHPPGTRDSQQQVLYIADDNEIRSLDPSVPNWVYEQTFQGDANVRIEAMDVHVKTNRIFWTNWHTGRISSYELPSSSSSSSSSSGPTSNSHRHRRQGESTNLQVGTGAGVGAWGGAG